jgi:outer membrane protein OmpA-like peptidoglycan-associated protein
LSAQQAQQEAANRRAAELEAQRNAEAAQRSAAQAELSAQQAARNAQAKAEADAARAAAEAARQTAETARQNAEAARLAASREADRLAQERAAAEAAKAEALAAQAAAQRNAAAAQQDAQQARQLAAKAEQERAELRDRLQRQLNQVLETKQTARGLIVNMSDVLFDVDRAALKPGAREKLAKVAGILVTHPDLTIKAEGHTDSTGGDEYNQRLSEERADSVRTFLVGQGIPSSAICAKGFGETLPVASNDSSAGRQQNRRVELVISGDSIDPSGDLSGERTAPTSNTAAVR